LAGLSFWGAAAAAGGVLTWRGNKNIVVGRDSHPIGFVNVIDLNSLERDSCEKPLAPFRIPLSADA